MPAYTLTFDAHPKRILLVDDEKSILESLSNYLEHKHFQVETATDGKQALFMLQEAPFDLVITDLVMNGISGMDLLAEIKKLDCDSGVFILSGQGSMASAIDAIRLGADDYLLKPCESDELVFRIEQFFIKQNLSKKLRIYEKLLPICMYCRKIRDDRGTKHGAGSWFDFEEYLRRRGGIALTHGCCPDCFEKYSGDFLKV